MYLTSAKLVRHLAVAFVFCVSTVSAAPVLLHIDNTHSSIQFSVPFMGVTTVNGNFERFCGTMLYNEEKISDSKIELFIDASSINTSLKIRDKDLRNSYLEVKDFPVIYFSSTNVESVDKKNFYVQGVLKLHGKFQTVSFNLSVVGNIINGDNASEIGFNISPFKINRNDFGVMENSMGTGTVGDTITTTSVVRLRDITPYRTEFDKKHPEETGKPKLFSGTYRNSKGDVISLLTFETRQFISYNSEDWSWLAELKSIGGNKRKTMSVTHRLEVTDKAVTLFGDDGNQIFEKVKL